MKNLTQKCSYIFLLILFLIGTTGSGSALAHPWGGLVVDQDGNIYFTFICPLVDDDHHACVWKIDNDQALSSVLRSDHSPSDIILSRSPDRVLYGAERSGSQPGFSARLWQFSGDQQNTIIPPTTDPDKFHIQSYAVSDDGSIYFGRDEVLYRYKPEGRALPVEVKGTFDRVDVMAWDPDGKLYIIDRDKIRILSEDGSLKTLVSGLKEEEPEHLPFSGANIFFDLTVDDTGNVFIAYYGNRRVLKVSPEGEITTFLQSEAPWSPHGVDIFNGELYVLESTVGGGSWWKIWEKPVIIPRIRKVAADGTVSIIYEHKPDQ